jgi:hypothetical protein
LVEGPAAPEPVAAVAAGGVDESGTFVERAVSACFGGGASSVVVGAGATGAT